MLPADTKIELHVTSLDATHSFWALQLGVKADANPGVDNVAFVQDEGPAHVRHPLRRALRALARLHVRHRPVVTPARVRRLGKQQQQVFASVAKYMPPYATTYYPDPQRRAG